ncbi:MAG: hypothetical protein JSW71_09275 [Gemmatimonadota bacterium]|nr:MAG: hypothetical protein JSW71_09275 [Gemmatimonadota bacterium]
MPDLADDLLTFHGPLLSIVQAALGMFVAVLVAKRIGSRLGVASDKRVNKWLLIAVAVLVAVPMVMLGRVGLHAGWPSWLYYPITLPLALLVPKYAFGLRWPEWAIYVAVAVATGAATHVLFSLLVGYGNYMPFWRIDPLWGVAGTPKSLRVWAAVSAPNDPEQHDILSVAAPSRPSWSV